MTGLFVILLFVSIIQTHEDRTVKKMNLVKLMRQMSWNEIRVSESVSHASPALLGIFIHILIADLLLVQDLISA